ncbi:MAG: hypothetical protein K5899_02500 [Bacteroidaceae bacterium]|nr:hypothetical protein [Bacteroidaceae bacterium]
MIYEEYYKELKDRMAAKSIDSLIELFNQQVGNLGWVSIRAVYNKAIIDSFIAKRLDISVIYDGITTSFARKITLNEDKTCVIFA